MKTIDHYWCSINPVSILLLPLTAIFCGLSLLRRQLYRHGLLPRYRAPVPVIIVGNISVGGTGKTPLIIELVRQLELKGHKPAVISRGYTGESKQWPLQVEHDTDAQKCGDEPALIYWKTACPVVVGPDRQADIKTLLANSECDVILSDDGMQHYALERDYEIAVVDAQRMFGNRLCLPSGPLRETVSRLKQVDLVLYNGASHDQCGFTMHPGLLQSVGEGQSAEIPLSTFTGQTVHAVAGIGNPERFFTMLESLGVNVIRHAFADHHRYSEQDFCFNDEHAILMTDKDAVKCRQFELQNCWTLGITLQMTELAQQEINKLYDTIFT